MKIYHQDVRFLNQESPVQIMKYFRMIAHQAIPQLFSAH